MSEVILKVKDLSVGFERDKVITGLDFSVNKAMWWQ